jgi:hypothetical protein
MLLLRDDISGTPDGVQQGSGNSTFEQNWIHDLRPGPDSHNDGIQLWGGPGVVIRGNHIAQTTHTGNEDAAILLSHDGGGFAAPVVEDNYLEGGGFALRLEDGVRDARVTGNRFGPLDGGFGEVSVDPGATVADWAGNTAADGRILNNP